MDRQLYNRQFMHLDVHHLTYEDTCILHESPCFDSVEYVRGWWVWNLPDKQRDFDYVRSCGFSESFLQVLQFALFAEVSAIHLSGLGDIVKPDKLWSDLNRDPHYGLELHDW